MATYYVDYDTGSDAANGTTTGTPWKYEPESNHATGVSAGTTLQPDDIVVFKGGVTHATYHDCYDAGTAGHPITRISGHLVGWGTGRAVIDGNAYGDAIFEVRAGAHYVTFNGLEVKRFANYGIYNGGGDYMIITNCVIHDRKDGGSGGCEPVFITDADYCRVEYCDLYNSTWNGINVQNANYTKIYYNDIHDCPAHGGINCISNTGTYYGMMDGLEIVGNYVHDNGVSQGCLYMRYQRNCLIANNVFECDVDCTQNNIYLAYGGTGGPTSYDATGCKFYNNTIIRGRWAIVNEAALNVEWRNNIVYVLDITALTTRYVTVYATITGNVFDYNHYYGTADGWYWLGTSDTTLAGWQTTSSQDANADFSDPAFVNLGGQNYHLTSGSPCRDDGEDLSGSGGLAYDKDLVIRPQGAAWDKGAYEWFDQQLFSVGGSGRTRSRSRGRGLIPAGIG